MHTIGHRSVHRFHNKSAADMDQAISISAAATVLGSQRHAIEDLISDRGDPRLAKLTAEGYRQYFTEPGGDVLAQCKRAIEAVLANSDIDAAQVDAVVVASDTMIDVGRHGARRGIAHLLEDTGLAHAYAYPLFLGECGNMLAGISLARGMIASGQVRKALIVASETRGSGTFSWNWGAPLSDSAVAAVVELDRGVGLRVDTLLLANDVALTKSRTMQVVNASIGIQSWAFIRRLAERWRMLIAREIDEGASVVYSNLRDAFNFMVAREFEIPYLRVPEFESRGTVAHAGPADMFISLAAAAQRPGVTSGSRVVLMSPSVHTCNIACGQIQDLGHFIVTGIDK